MTIDKSLDGSFFLSSEMCWSKSVLGSDPRLAAMADIGAFVVSAALSSTLALSAVRLPAHAKGSSKLRKPKTVSFGIGLLIMADIDTRCSIRHLMGWPSRSLMQ